MKENYLIKEFGTRLRLPFVDEINFRKKFQLLFCFSWYIPRFKDEVNFSYSKE